jgi:hypothetical protein
VESSERLGRHRWQAEQSIAWLLGCRRLRIRYDRGSERFYAFGMLACCRLAFNRCPRTPSHVVRRTASRVGLCRARSQRCPE